MHATTADVLVVGGGVHGASAAWRLSERGVDVLLVERGELAGGPTGRSSAICRAYYTDPFLARMARASLEVFADFPAHTGGRDAGFHRTGGLFVHGPGDVQTVRATAAQLTAIGTRTDVLDPAELAERFPRLSRDGLACAAYEHGAGYADPVSTTTALVERARELGAGLRIRTEVVALDLHPGTDRGVRVTLSGGERVSAGRVLLAAGPWTAPLARQVGVELPLTVERHVVATFATGRSAHLGAAAGVEATRLGAHDQRGVRGAPGELGDLGSPGTLGLVLADIPAGYYAKPELGGGFLMGPLTPAPPIDDPDGVDERIHDDEVAALAHALVRRVPDLDAAQPRGGWASLYDVSPDWQPVIGEIAPGVVVDAGTSGHGFKLAPALGGEVAALVLGEPDPALAAFRPERFATGGQLAAGYGAARILG